MAANLAIQAIKNSAVFSLYYGTHVKITRLERLINREFNGSFQPCAVKCLQVMIRPKFRAIPTLIS